MCNLGIDIAIGSYDKSITIYRFNIVKDDHIKIILNINNQNNCGYITSCDISDFFLCIASKNQNVKIYNIKTGIDLGHLDKHNGFVSSVLFYQTSHLFTASQDGIINVYTTRNWNLKATLKSNAPILSMGLHPTGRILLTIDKSLNLVGWDLIKAELIVRKKMPRIAKDVFWNMSGKLFAVLRETKILVYNQKGKLYSIVKHQGQITCATFLKDRFVVLGTEDRKIIVWDARSNVKIRKIEFHNNRVKCISMVELLKLPFIITADSDGLVAIWNGNSITRLNTETKDCFLSAFDSRRRITSMSVKPI